MKNLLFVALMLISSFVMSQTSGGYDAWVPVTNTNADTTYLVLSSNPVDLTKDYVVTMTVVPVNTSGTATALAMPQGSFDNTKFFDLQSAADTVDNAGTAVDKIYEYANAHWQFYRVELITSGTGVINTTGEFGLKKAN